MLIYGINPVLEALRAGRVKELRVADRAGARVAELLETAGREGIPIRRVAEGDLDRLARGGVHQSVVAELQAAAKLDVADLVAGAKGAPLLVVGGAAAKASAGAVAHVKIAEVVNIARALEELKAAGVWTVGLAADVQKTYDQVDLTLPTAFVLGAEGSGLRRLVRERCDWIVSIPLQGHVQSLNVSVAAGIALFEAVRQRAKVSRSPALPDAIEGGKN
jgi:23S rRNA (guanosine2251-2'-O)-methyltransferase